MYFAQVSNWFGRGNENSLYQLFMLTEMSDIKRRQMKIHIKNCPFRGQEMAFRERKCFSTFTKGLLMVTLVIHPCWSNKVQYNKPILPRQFPMMWKLYFTHLKEVHLFYLRKGIAQTISPNTNLRLIWYFELIHF